MADQPFRILGIPGSLRRASWNKGLLRAAKEEAPPGVEIGIHEVGDLPAYNQDVDQAGAPPAVEALRQAIRGADALLLSTAEYNYSVPGFLKNAIDWASRPFPDHSLRHKPVGLMGASSGQFGTVRAQLAWRQVFIFTESYVMLMPELLVFEAAGRFDDDGNLTDDSTRALLRRHVEALVGWARKCGAGR